MTIRNYCLTLLLLVVSASGLASQGKQEAAEQAALEWLGYVDTSAFDASWEEAASLFRAQVSRSDWARAVGAARSPFGELISRELVSAHYTTTLPGAPDGEYVVLQFQTRFEKKAQAIETVTPMLDSGQWRVSGYYIR